MGLVLEAMTKAMVYAALMLAVGACVVHWLLRSRMDAVRLELTQALDRRVARLESQAAILLLVAVTLRVLAHTAAAFGTTEALSWQRISIISLESRWGGAWRLQAMAAGVLVLVARSIRDDRRAGWPVASVVSAGTCYLLALAGHAAGSVTRVLVHGSHVLGAGVWLGTLATLFVLRQFEEGLSTRDALMNPSPTGSMLYRFAPIALSGAVIVTAAGLVATWLYVGSISNLLATIYGRVLTLKLVAFGAVVGCGFSNWRALHGRSTANQPGSRQWPKSAPAMSLELICAGVVIIITSVVTELEHP